MAKADKSKTRSARGTGRLYKRSKGGKEYSSDSKTPGVFWIQYTNGTKLNGKGKQIPNRVRHALTGTDGKPITDLRKAEAERKRLTAPLRAGKRADQIQALTASLKQAEAVEVQAVEDAAPILPIVEAWEAYLQNPDRPDSGDGTLRNYAGHWKRFCEWIKKTEPNTHCLREITHKTAQDYAATLNGGTVSPNTYNKHTSFLKLFFRVLLDDAGLKENPFEKIRRKNLKTESRRELTLAELKEILETASGDLQTLLYLGTFTGLRLGDCCTLKWGETDLDRGLIRRVPNKTAKNRKPVLVGIPAALHKKLSETPKTKRKGYVLPRFAELYTYRNETGRLSKQPFVSNEIQKIFTDCEIQTHKEGTGKGTGKRAVVEVGFHSLRHTYVSLHAEAGTPQAMIQANVGHSNPSMTAHYTHVNEAAARQVACVLTLNAAEETVQKVPDWIKEKLQGMTAKNWKQIKTDLLKGEG